MQPQMCTRSRHQTPRKPPPAQPQSTTRAHDSCGKAREEDQEAEAVQAPRTPHQRSTEQPPCPRASTCMRAQQSSHHSQQRAPWHDHTSERQARTSSTRSFAHRDHSQSRCLLQAEAPRQYTAGHRDSGTSDSHRGCLGTPQPQHTRSPHRSPRRPRYPQPQSATQAACTTGRELP